ncbi:MFS transporter [Agrobacterium tumefaciens]|uniref:MFS transporter n=1 Tax=Agrobacterium tumefaciens TaxID=358 RepID=A0AA44F6U0_AGRTU|nr:MFS transporter [Agrobacterium tumefaciens]NTB87594.1 MFS transporter [Agrobacterium tumefaciens]NTC16136.1 MFS transporter [Agrobacterium tumefaciens]NTC29639.1 MFS transporter [Agrobacterium tumefaciens]
MIQLRNPHAEGMRSHVVLAATVTATAVAAGVNVMPIFLADSLIREMNWSEPTLFAGISIGMILSALAAPVSFYLISQFGLRTVMVGALVTLLLGLLGSAVADSAATLALVWIVSAAAGGCLSPMVIGAVVTSRYYPHHCGATSSLYFSAALLGPSLALPLTLLITAPVRWHALVIAASAVAAVLVGVMALIPKHASFPRTRNHEFTRVAGIGAMAKNPNFWLLLFMTIVCGVTSSGLVDNHLVSLCRSQGLPPQTGASAVAFSALAALLGGLIFGICADRFTGLWLLASYFLGRSILLIWLPKTSLSFEELAQFSILYGLDWAATMPALMRVAVRSFGAQGIAPVMSILALAHHASGAATTFLVSVAGPQFYASGFIAGGVFCLITAFLLVATSPLIRTGEGLSLRFSLQGGQMRKS